MRNAEHGQAGRGRGGFSLVEVLVASAILAIFGLMAVGTLRYGTELWRSGHRRSNAYDVATIVFQQLEDDLGASKSQFWNLQSDAFDTRVKFWLDVDQGGRQRLRLVRGIPDDIVNPRLRQAGDGVDNDGDGEIDDEYYNLRNDDPGSPPRDLVVDEDLKPLEGMCEVAYMMGQSDGHKTLYRAVLSPIAGANTLFDNDNIDDADPVVAQDRIGGQVGGVALPLARDVLYFEVRCRTQYTTGWDPAVPFRRWALSYVPEPCGPAMTWDSDRLNPTGYSGGPQLDGQSQLRWDSLDAAGPYFVMDWGQPYFPDSNDDMDPLPNSIQEDYVRDNVFPRAVMVIMVVEPPEKMRDTNPLRLRAPVLAADRSVSVTGAQPVYNERWPYILIEDETSGTREWMRFSDFVPDDQGGTFVVADLADRGARDPNQQRYAFPVGALVKLGNTFSRVFHNPAGRDYWGQ